MTSSVANIVNTTPSVTSDTASKASSSSRSSTTTECSSVEEVVIHDQPEEEGIELSLQNFEPNSNYCLRWDFFSFSNYLFSIEASKAPLRRSRMEAIKTTSILHQLTDYEISNDCRSLCPAGRGWRIPCAPGDEAPRQIVPTSATTYYYPGLLSILL